MMFASHSQKKTGVVYSIGMTKSFGRIISVILTIWLLSAGISFGADARPVLVIYHTNDVHGYVFHETNEDGLPTRWGYDYVKSMVDRDLTYNKLLLDAGNVLSGQSFANARRGELVSRMLAMMHYDAIAAGNHDFDFGWERLLSLRDVHRLPFLSANVRENIDNRRILLSYTTRNFPNLKVGIFGLSTPSTPTTTDPRNVAALSFESPEETIKTAREIVRRLREVEEADIVIALTHLGSEPYNNPSSLTLARETPGIDLIIDGHSQSELAGLKIGGTTIASTGAFLKNLGRIEVFRSDDGGFEFKTRLLPASESGSVAVKPELSSSLEILREDMNSELDVVTAHTPIYLDGDRGRIRSGSTNMGRMVCAALMNRTGADAAIINSGTIMDSIPRGNITKGILLTVMPFGNYTYTVGMTGADILDTLRSGLSRPGTGAFPQFYGLSVKARRSETVTPDGTAEAFIVEEVTIGGRPLYPDVSYIIAINDFMYRGGDGYTQFAKYPFNEFATMENIFNDFISAASTEVISLIDRTKVLTVE